MERLTEKLPDGRVILKNHYTVIRSNRIGSFIEGEAVDKLAEYEDAEEQGLLLRLQESDWNDLIKELAVIVANDFLIYIDEREFIINQIFLLEHDEEFRFSATCGNFYGDEICWECNNDKECPYSEDGNGCFITFSFSDIGKSVFLTKAEAEKALAEMG